MTRGPQRGPQTIDLRESECGFDLRAHPDMRVQVPILPAVMVRYDGSAGDEEASGPSDHIGRVLRRAHYRVRWQWETMPADMGLRIVTARDGSPELEMRDPGDGAGTRYRYRVHQGRAMRRHLPARGERWRDEPAPAWWEPLEPATLAAPSPVAQWIGACGGPTPWEQEEMTRHIVAWTPTGREVRYERGGVGIQPPRDNWWYRCADLAAARTWWYTQAGA